MCDPAAWPASCRLPATRSAARFQVQGRPTAKNARTYLNNVGPRYFDTMGIRLLRGRDFRPTDRIGSPPVAIVNEAFQRAYFPGEDAVGQHVGYGEPFSEIVGLVKDSAFASVGNEPTPVLYYSYAQVPSLSTQARPLMVHLRTDGDPAGAIRAVTRAIADVDNKVAFDVKTIREATTFEFAMRRLGSGLLGSLGAVGLLLAMIGLYGVVAYTVASRTPEIGIRMALGASSHRVLWSVLGQGLRLVGLGVAVGTVLSLLDDPRDRRPGRWGESHRSDQLRRYGDRSGLDWPCRQLFPRASCDTDRPVDGLAQRVADTDLVARRRSDRRSMMEGATACPELA